MGEILIENLHDAIRDFETGDELTEVILLGKSGAIRRVFL